MFLSTCPSPVPSPHIPSCFIDCSRYFPPVLLTISDTLHPTSFTIFRYVAFADDRIMAHEHSIDKLTAIWLLPVVAPIVAAATGGNLCTVIPADSAALQHTLVASYILWGTGVPFALSILVLYIHRLTVYKVPIHPLSTKPPYNIFTSPSYYSPGGRPAVVDVHFKSVNSSSPPPKS